MKPFLLAAALALLSASAAAQETPGNAIIVTTQDIPAQYEELGDVHAEIQPTSMMPKIPVRQSLNEELRAEAAKRGANAVIKVVYGKRSFLDKYPLGADGKAVRITMAPPAPVSASISPPSAPSPRRSSQPARACPAVIPRLHDEAGPAGLASAMWALPCGIAACLIDTHRGACSNPPQSDRAAIHNVSPLPRTAPLPGPGQLRVRNEAIGLNFIDIYFRTGLYPAALPFTPGNEGAGVVLAVGDGVKGFKKGDRVAYISTLGAYAGEINIAAASVVPLPKSVSFDKAAALMLKGLTAEYLLFRSFPVKKGHAILVHAAAGGVGLILCQWAKSLGCTVIGTAGSKDKAKLAKKNGCDHVILYREENFVERVKEITKGKKCDVVYDGVGKDTFPASLDCLKPRGFFISFGNASGAVEAFNMGLLAQKGSLYAQRPTLFSYIADRKTYEQMAKRLFKAVENGDFKIPLSQRWPLGDVAKAHEALAGRATTGSMVLKP